MAENANTPKLREYFNHPTYCEWENEDRVPTCSASFHSPFRRWLIFLLTPAPSLLLPEKMDLLPCSTLLKVCSCFVKLDIPGNVCIRITQYSIMRKSYHTSPLPSSFINNPRGSLRVVDFESHWFFSAVISVERCQSQAQTLWGSNIGKGSPPPEVGLWCVPLAEPTLSLPVCRGGCIFQTYVNVVQGFLWPPIFTNKR